ATIEVDAFRDRKFKGIVTEIGSSAKGLGSTSAEQVTNFNVKVRILPESYKDLSKDKSTLTSPFKPGLSATVDIHTETNTGLSVPIQAVTTREALTKAGSSSANKEAINGVDTIEDAKTEMKSAKATSGSIVECVFVYRDGKVFQREVTTGIQDDKYIRILTGLEEGDEVVTSPFTAISKTLK